MEKIKYSCLMSIYYKENVDNLKKSLDSIYNQTVLCDEVVLVEDGPLTDELYKVIDDYKEKYKNIHLVKLPKNVGLGPALKEGVEACSNELIARFDSDDISVNDRCEKQISEFKMDKDLDIIGSNHIEFVDNIENKNSFSYKKLPSSNEEIIKYTKKRNPFSHSAVMFKKKALLMLVTIEVIILLKIMIYGFE